MLPDFFKEKYFGVCQDYYEKLKQDCKLCNHNGYIMKDETTYKDCKCTIEFLKNKEYIKKGVPVSLFINGNGKFVETFSAGCQERFKVLVKMLRQTEIQSNIFIHCTARKDYGTSFLASLLAINLMDKDLDVGMIKSHELIDTFFNFERDEKGWDSLFECKILIIDGFGQENNKQLLDEESFVSTRLMNLLNHRSSMNCITVISGDLLLEDLKVKYSKSLMEFFVLDCLKFEIDVIKKKENAIEQLKKINPEYAKIFSTNKVSAPEGERVKPKTQTNRPLNRGRIL